MQAMVTRCPKCSTAFKITEKQIDSAKGAVRCGSCLHIFNAKENLVQAKQTPPAPAPDIKKATPLAAEQTGFHFNQQAINDEYLQDSTKTSTQPEARWSIIDDSESDDDLIDSSIVFADDGKDDELIIDDDTLFGHNEDDDFLISDDMDFDDEGDSSTHSIEGQADKNEEDYSLTDKDANLATSDDGGDFLISDNLDLGLEDNEDDFLISDDLDLSLEDNEDEIELSDIEGIDSKDSHEDTANNGDDFLISDDLDFAAEDSDEEIDLSDMDGISSTSSSGYETSSDDFLTSDRKGTLAGTQSPSGSKTAADNDNFFFDDLNPELDNISRDNSGSRFSDDENDEDSDSTDESWAKAILDELEKEEQDSHENLLFGDRQNTHKSYDQISLTDEKTEPPSTHNETEQLAPEFIEAFAKIDQNYRETGRPLGDEQYESATKIDEPLRADKADRIHFHDNDQQRNDKQEKHQLLQNIQPEPVEMDWIRVSRSWPKKLIWWTLCLLAALVLAGQFAWIKFDHWSRTEPYRPYYAMACNIIGCKLPSLIDTDKIKVSNLVIRSHPQTKNALTVDAILINNASFDQPFPDLVISFSDLDGNTVAARRFKPEEYLAGELAGKNKIPRNQPVHLSMDIADPGRQAVNYQAYIPAQPSH